MARVALQRGVAGLAVAGAALLAVAATAAAKEPIVGETLPFESKALGEQRTIVVSVPPDYADDHRRYPVLFLVEGGPGIVRVRGTVDFLARQGLIPQLIVVGVADTDPARDLTPAGEPSPSVTAAAAPARSRGETDPFLAFMGDELAPFVDAHFRTVPFRIFSGRGLAGLFGTYALLTRPGLFNAVIAASPTLGWNDAFVVRRARELFAGGAELRAAYFITRGAEAPADRAAVDEMAAALRDDRPKGLRWSSMQLGSGAQASTLPLSTYYGLRMIFEGWEMPAPAAEGSRPVTAAEVEAHYVELSDRLGFTVTPEERAVARLGRRALRNGHPEVALGLCRFNLAMHPDSAEAYDSLGEALEANGQRDLAAASYRRAFEIATRTKDPNALIFQRHLERLTSKPEKSK